MIDAEPTNSRNEIGMDDVAETTNARKKPVRKQKYYTLTGCRRDNGSGKVLKFSQTVGQLVKYYRENRLLIDEIFDKVEAQRVYLLNPETGKVLDAIPVEPTTTPV